MRARPALLAAPALAALALVLVGCGVRTTGFAGPAEVVTAPARAAPSATPDGAAAAPDGPAPAPVPDPDGGPCPVAFTEVGEAPSTTGTTSADVFTPGGEWWTCVYAAGPSASAGWWIQWQRAAPPRRVTAPATAQVLRSLVATTAEADPEGICTADLGPRLVAVHTGGAERSRPAVVWDLFGCGHLRLLPGVDDLTLSGLDPVLAPALDAAAQRRLEALVRRAVGATSGP